MKNTIAKLKIGRNNRLIGTKKDKSLVYSVIPVELKKRTRKIFVLRTRLVSVPPNLAGPLMVAAERNLKFHLNDGIVEEE
jgi:hypothetical protein